MPWPEQIGLLLGMPDSTASQALRWGLRGLRASLQAALDDGPESAGSEELRTLLTELDCVLGGARPPSSPTLPLDTPGGTLPDDRSTDSPRLLPLARAIAADPRFRVELERAPIREGSDDEIWNDVQRLLLRAAPNVAEEWRRRCLKHAEEAGGHADEGQAVVLPSASDEVIYPGLSGAVRAVGLRSAAAAALDPRMTPPKDADLRALAGVVSSSLWFIEHDPNLCHCLQSVFRFGVSLLAGQQQERYMAELLRLWERTNVPPRQEPKERLKNLLDLDEAIHSLVYQPPAAPDSWWGRLQGQSRDVLYQARDRAVQAGGAVHLQLLGGSFAAINRLAPESLQVDFGEPGEVCVCLRVWARIDGEQSKGRVLYGDKGLGTGE
jgi:hypothetical protein